MCGSLWWWGGAQSPFLAEQTLAGDCLQPLLVPRCGFRQRLKRSVRQTRGLDRKESKSECLESL